MDKLSDIENHLHALALDRPLFHSEADFQHALAWHLQRTLIDVNIRLEKPFRHNPRGSKYLDLMLMIEGSAIAIELKYKTKKIKHRHNGEEFDIQNHGAQDIGRYDFLADVARLEEFVSVIDNCDRGYAILLTNEPSYWALSSRPGTVDERFRLHEGREISGTLGWLDHASAGTTRGRENPITLDGKYNATWRDFSSISSEPGGQFRFLAWQID
ncbi:MAG: hypothetical protein EBT06_09710 [Gammaproteobacteria bacterium]|nr:hypothetical protein [Gammaproteobacteria bacterium]NBT45180.1 hypothetical protein [Gammaproteobacteria bacterium]NBY21946.1 hypothetical protein [Gammaproteobacteria bacterium]